jgi:hypothetical protein
MTGAPRFLVLSGELGIGKTSLIAALGRRAEAAGCLVLNGSAAELELIGHLLRHPPDAAVMLVASLRTGQAPAMLAAAIENAARSGRVIALELGPLSHEDAARLVGATMAPTAVDALYRESGGNPFYLLQLARRGAGR